MTLKEKDEVLSQKIGLCVLFLGIGFLTAIFLLPSPENKPQTDTVSIFLYEAVRDQRNKYFVKYYESENKRIDCLMELKNK